jgi:tRNA(fMet)-specific endonuclease VapC
VVAEEVMRGQLSAIRRAQARVARVSLEQAYAYLQEALSVLRNLQFLPYTTVAHALFQAWRAANIRVGTQDLRIAAICVAHGVRLVTRNARDYSQIPGLIIDVWN